MQRPRLDWWVCLALILALVQGALFLVPQARPGGLVGVLCWYFGGSLVLWLTMASIVLVFGILRSARRRPFWNRWRLAGYLTLLVLAVSPLAFRTYPSSHDQQPSTVRFRLPLDGPITVGWGGAASNVNYHVVAPDQRWAYDLAVTKDGESSRGDGRNLDDYYCYRLPVRAPAAGTVYATSTGDPDLAIGVSYTGRNLCGNQVVLEVRPHEFLFLCHLQPGSVPVQKGDHVTVGQVLGRVGNSGNSSEPHLHIHLQDGPKLHLAEGIPLYFYGYRVGGLFVERGIPTGGVASQIVEHVGD